MSFDKETRNLLAKAVTACRRRLNEDITDQLRSIFGLHPDGTVLPLEEMSHLSPDQTTVASRLRDLLDHYTAGSAGGEEENRKSAYKRMALEISFTSLNRLAALRLCEERGLVVECVRKGTASDGFRLFERVTGGALGGRFDTYRVFLECLFDELALDVGVLFDRMTPQSSVFPSERCMDDVLSELNKPELSRLWTEDETIGWIFQYFYSEEDRKKAGKGKRPPKDSYELAVRNQFFTPRYVVEFLTDNTLGRIWYEMRQGNTILKKNCQYLIQRPNEVFLRLGENSPSTSIDDDNAPYEDLVKAPLYIDHRPKKDPRNLLILDPACGSGHFLLYAFDLLEQIYEEAWEDTESPNFALTGNTLRQDFKTVDDLRKAVPILIIENNLHGIDIDSRAVQIAALALWLRAQKTWNRLNIKSIHRPPVEKANIVTAESMPGEEDLRREYLHSLDEKSSLLVEQIFEQMSLAGEAGSLLRIEKDIPEAIRRIHKKHGNLFRQSDAERWEKAERDLLSSLKVYAEKAENDKTILRQLFSKDAAGGFGFIDLCRKRYDVLLMNPPFGNLSENSKSYIELNYPSSKGNILAHFLERAAELTHADGKVAAIVSRTCFFLTTMSEFRVNVLGKDLHIGAFADLGSGVLDAMVETSAVIFNRRSHYDSNAVFFRLLCSETKNIDLLDNIVLCSNGHQTSELFITSPNTFQRLDGVPYVYWITPKIINLIASYPKFEPAGCDIRVGLQTSKDFRFLRLWYEVPQEQIVNISRTNKTEAIPELCIDATNRGMIWAWYSKIDKASPFAAPIHLVVNWGCNGLEIKANHVQSGNSISRYVRSESNYFKPGLSYMLRSSRLVPYIVPNGVIPTAGRSQIYPKEGKEQWILALAASNIASAIARFHGENFGQPKFQNSMVASIPYIDQPKHLKNEITNKLKSLRENQKAKFTSNETCIEFVSIPTDFITQYSERLNRSSLLGKSIDLQIGLAFGLNENDMAILERDLMDSVGMPNWVNEDCDAKVGKDEAKGQLKSSLKEEIHALISYAVGSSFGRWDIRIATGECQPMLSNDPFALLPVCPPGMLQNSNGFPAKPKDVPSDYPININWNGILVDDQGFNGTQSHRDDIVRRVREVLDHIWKNKANEIEQEACDILGVSCLRDYFRKPTKFFQDHLKRYSKSRRKAPIYWPLSTASGSYTIWLYYHRLTDQTLFAVVNQYIEPKITEIERGIRQVEDALNTASGRKATLLRDQLNEAQTFLSELRDFGEELLRIAEMPYKPDLNDGVIINAAPLNDLFKLRSWANDTKKIWDKLKNSEYDWAHLAYTIWSSQVREACKKDRSIAIAHGLEDLCEV